MKNLFEEEVNSYDKVSIRTIDGKESNYQDVISITENEDYVFVKGCKILKAYLKKNILSISLIEFEDFNSINY